MLTAMKKNMEYFLLSVLTLNLILNLAPVVFGRGLSISPV